MRLKFYYVNINDTAKFKDEIKQVWQYPLMQSSKIRMKDKRIITLVECQNLISWTLICFKIP